jgi:hypothetical protein
MDSPSSDVSKQDWTKIRRMFVRAALRRAVFGFALTLLLVSRYQPTFFSWRLVGILRGVATFALWVGLAYLWRLWRWRELQAAVERSQKS